MTIVLVLVLALALPAPKATAGEEGPAVALLKDPGEAADTSAISDYFQRTRRALRSAGVRTVTVTQQDVLAGELGEFKVTVIPHAPNLNRAARAALKTFCADGGGVVCFYTTYGLDRELGLRGTTYVRDERRQRFRYVRLRGDALPDLPEGFAQTSWNIRAPRPLQDTRVLGEWLNSEREPAGHPAATLSERGMFFSHVLTTDDADELARAGRMLRAAIEYLRERTGSRRRIAVVYGTHSRRADRPDSGLVDDMVERTGRLLESAGLSYAVVPDEAVERGALEGRRVAIFPLNFQMTDREVRAVREFAADGGRVIACFTVDPRLLPLAGVQKASFKSGGSDSPFQVVRSNDRAPEGFPGSFRQDSPNAMEAVAADEGTVIAGWHDSDGADTGLPAVILGPQGLYFSYILRSEDPKAAQFLLAAIAHLGGERFYRQAAEHAMDGLWELRRHRTADALREACERPEARRAFQEARAAARRGEKALAAGQHRPALQALRRAREAAELAFIRSLPSRSEPEFRGVWIHDPYVPEDDWDAHFQRMRRAHLNALLPNVCTGGYAHYESDVLPLSRMARERGDQMRRMLDAARRHGVEVHLWRVNFDLFWPGRERIEQLAAENRVCRDPQGDIVAGPNNATLCPSHPENQRLEVTAMLEMARKFRPDGIHFDYIRYPGPQACYGPGCRRRFEQEIGRQIENWPDAVLGGGELQQQYLDFRREQINTVVHKVSTRVREEAPEVMLSAAVFSNWQSYARDGVAQDWPMWVEKGWLDFVCPMDYTQDVEELADIVTRQQRWVAERVPLMVGVGAWRSPAGWHLADLVDTARTNGADGLVFFQYRGRVVDELIPALTEGPLREDARTPW